MGGFPERDLNPMAHRVSLLCLRVVAFARAGVLLAKWPLLFRGGLLWFIRGQEGQGVACSLPVLLLSGSGGFVCRFHIVARNVQLPAGVEHGNADSCFRSHGKSVGCGSHLVPRVSF